MVARTPMAFRTVDDMIGALVPVRAVRTAHRDTTSGI